MRVNPLHRGWHESLGTLIREANSTILIVAPFISQEGSRFVLDRLSSQMKEGGQLRVLTDLSPVHVCDGSLEPTALKSLYDATPAANLWHVPRLHAKVYVADSFGAIVTSGNLTSGGLYRNLEYGIEIRDQGQIAKILDHFDLYVSLATAVTREQLVGFENAAIRVREAFLHQQRTASQSAVDAFREILRETEDELVRLRLAGGAVHAVFARTISYLLGRLGPMATVQLHGFVQELHPELCDDSIDRVIDGQSFGKKWKHAVRTAQQVLKKKGEIEYVDGLWRTAGGSASPIKP